MTGHLRVLMLGLLVLSSSWLPCGCGHSASSTVAPTPVDKTRAAMGSPEAYTVEWLAPADQTEGPCDAVEYTAFRLAPSEVALDVTVGANGRASHLRITRANDDAERIFAADVVRHLFRCRHKVAADAVGQKERYRLRFAPVLHSPTIDASACGRAVVYPDRAMHAGSTALVHVGVGVDIHGQVDVAWVDGATGNGFAEAAVDAIAHRCKFGPATVNGEPIPFFLIYTFNFTFPR